MPEPTPEFVFFIRNQFSGKNYVIAEEQRFLTLPEKVTPMIGFKNLPKGMVIKRVEMTVNELSSTEYKDPWRFGGDNAITPLPPDDYLFAASAYTQSEGGTPVLSAKRRFSVGPAPTKPPVKDPPVVTDPKPDPKPVDPPKPPAGQIVITQGVASGLNQKEYPIAIVAPLYREAGVKLIRNWHDIDEGRFPKAGDDVNYRLFTKEGFKIFTCVQMEHAFDSDQKLTDYVNAFCDVYGQEVTAVELLNEPNIHYWQDSFDNAVRTMRVMNKAFQKRGILTCSGGPSGDTDSIGYLRRLSAAGILKEVDKVGIHAYGRKDPSKKLTASQIHNQRIEQAHEVAAANGKALWCGEDNMHIPGSGEFVEEYPKMMGATRKFVEVSCYYRGVARPVGDSPAAHMGLLQPGTFKKNQPYFDTVKDEDK